MRLRHFGGAPDPMRDVTGASWESVPKCRRGYVVGSQVRWTLTLSCGHTAKRNSTTGSLKPPKRARCRDCGALDPIGGES